MCFQQQIEYFYIIPPQSQAQGSLNGRLSYGKLTWPSPPQEGETSEALATELEGAVLERWGDAWMFEPIEVETTRACFSPERKQLSAKKSSSLHNYVSVLIDLTLKV